MKKGLLIFGALVIAIAAVPMFAAFEAHVINVTAHIENALSVHPKEIAFGTVFPQEYTTRDFNISLSESFMGADRVDDVQYVIKQKPKFLKDTRRCFHYALIYQRMMAIPRIKMILPTQVILYRKKHFQTALSFQRIA
jgi:hypothetical protein